MGMYDATSTIGEFLEAAAARHPTPGGGAVAALAGALAAAMGEMVIHYSIGKQPEADEMLRGALAELGRARALLVGLMAEDQAAFESLTAARKIADPREKQEQYNMAMLACVRVPQAMAAIGLSVLEISDRVVDRSSKWLLSDLAVCCELAMATVRCGVYNVRVNLASMEDARDRASLESAGEKMLERALPLIQRCLPRIWERQRKRA